MTDLPDAVRIAAPAKLNLALRVLGRRADGYHEIASILQAIGLHDTIDLRAERGALRLDVTGADFDLPPERNLAWRAAAAYLQAAGRDPAGFVITLRKRIPSGAGLGGGSSDAAAVLRAMARMLGDPLDRDAVRRIAADLGSDVPFFLGHSPALATGRGERLARLAPFGPLWYVLIKPPMSVETAWAYGALGLTVTPALSTIPGFDSTEVEALREVGNDLERGVLERYPEVAAAKAALVAAGADDARMTGSGSAVFGVFRDRRRARNAEEKLRARGGWWTATARPVNGDLWAGDRVAEGAAPDACWGVAKR